MERQQCKLCFKNFSSGKALGGHMRSHYAALPLPPKTPQRQEIVGPLVGDTESTSSQFSVEDGDEKSIRMVDPKFLDAAGSVVIKDKQNLSESTSKKNKARSSSKQVIKKRNIGKPRSAESLAELEMVSSSVSEEEDGAWCLLMLSRNVWSLSDSVELGMCQLTTKKYQCETCEKEFKSPQGLGSHRTSHKMIKNSFDRHKTGTKIGKTFEEIEFSNDRIKLDLNQPAVSDAEFINDP
ncbi:Zinc finger protein ZAT9 [Abeliophyllum distichum]|uniref:Zinc finger protein ZAT9 n=1 Tax=Abeliophyllum distichum TaxID=126358 RepID=A0ABD1TZH6_9LAMI